MGVDFAGGTILHVKFNYPVMDQTIRDIFEKDLKIKDVVIQTAEQVEVSNNMTQTAASKGGSTEKLIRTVFLTDKPGKDQLTFQEVKSAIDNGLASRGVKTEAGEAVVIEKTLSEESVGATISHELKYQAMVAILISIILLLGYITVQFEFSFAVPAIIALVHDTMAAIGFLIVTGYEINMIMLAVMLTIVGYSINDTIVISDRIRENMKIMRRTKFHELVNISLNQTFKRTVITTTTTLLPLITMALVGGPVLRQFAVPMIFGALIGTYSSIYVVSSLLVTWKTSKEVVSKSGKVVDA
jgi:preprotein translocase SecF subunit